MGYLRARNAFETPLVSIRDVACTSGRSHASCEEYASRPTFVFPRRGVFEWSVCTRTIVADAHTALLFHPRSAFTIAHPGDSGDDCTAIDFRTGDIADALGDVPAGPRCWIFDRATQRRVRSLLHALSGSEVLQAEECAFELLELLVGAPHNNGISKKIGDVETIRAAIAAAPEERLTLSDLGRIAGCSPYHLARRFRAHTGTSIHQYRLNLRLAMALERIAQGQDDLSALAHDCGFSSHSHMTSAFVKTYGAAPTVFRK